MCSIIDITSEHTPYLRNSLVVLFGTSWINPCQDRVNQFAGMESDHESEQEQKETKEKKVDLGGILGAI